MCLEVFLKNHKIIGQPLATGFFCATTIKLIFWGPSTFLSSQTCSSKVKLLVQNHQNLGLTLATGFCHYFKTHKHVGHLWLEVLLVGGCKKQKPWLELIVFTATLHSPTPIFTVNLAQKFCIKNGHFYTKKNRPKFYCAPQFFKAKDPWGMARERGRAG